MSEIFVIGAGPAGLAAAYELSKQGRKSTIIEADNQVGGLSRTANYKQFRFDIGGHRFFTKIPYIQRLWEEILGEDLLRCSRQSRIYYRKKFFDYPLKLSKTLANLGPWESFLIALSYAKIKLRPRNPDKNFEEWVTHRFGYRLYNTFFKTYTEKVWGLPCKEISADWAAQRIKNLSLTEVLRNAIFNDGRSKSGNIITTLIDEFYYPRLGPGMMWERCAELLKQYGNEIVMNVGIDKISHQNGKVKALEGVTPNGERMTFHGQHFISSMPISELVRILDPPAPEEILQTTNQLSYRDYLTVVLLVNREYVFPDNWIYIHSPEVRMGRIQNYKNWSPDMVPESSKTSLGLEYFLWDKDEEWLWSDEKLINLGIRECHRIGILEPHEVYDGTVVRMKKAYPVYDQNYQTALVKIKKYLETLTNLQTIGRNGLHRYNNQDHSMLTGIYAARNILGEKFDVWSVNTETEYHEESSAPESSMDSSRMVPTRVTSQSPPSK